MAATFSSRVFPARATSDSGFAFGLGAALLFALDFPGGGINNNFVCNLANTILVDAELNLTVHVTLYCLHPCMLYKEDTNCKDMQRFMVPAATEGCAAAEADEAGVAGALASCARTIANGSGTFTNILWSTLPCCQRGSI